MSGKYIETSTELCLKLKQMKLSGMAEAIERQSGNPNIDLVSFEERIADIINSEWDMRYTKKFNRYLRKAQLRYPEADFDETIYDTARSLDTETIERLIDCHWIDEGRNLLITGNAGTGKTYLANALCICALKKFKTVRYGKSNTIIYELEKADLENRHLEYVSYLAKTDLLILDDFGLMDLDPDKCRNLFEIIDAREARRSTVVISQLPVKAWYDLFKDNTYADSCMDRLVHKAYRLEFHGKNMRNPNL
ncbi:MAG: IS21-like element helper ATPase IstB [Erysipelotrichaceae bacterium]|nr:IS21-like element helper ATPase IstB [Erysipelotrichaceae bacterium]